MTSTLNGYVSMGSLGEDLERRTMKEQEEEDDIHKVRRMRPRGSCCILSRDDALGNMHLQSMAAQTKFRKTEQNNGPPLFRVYQSNNFMHILNVFWPLSTTLLPPLISLPWMLNSLLTQ